ncbi:hypothetical protein SOVF_174570 [Spinacia oleracea]|nr:hypothetical protein SOVF_174570 [Spinacia oleracea]
MSHLVYFFRVDWVVDVASRHLEEMEGSANGIHSCAPFALG